MSSVNLNIRKTFCVFSALLTFCLFVSAVLMSVGITFARYYTAETLEVSFDPQNKCIPQISYDVTTDSGGAWQSANGTHSLAFSLSNQNEEGVFDKDCSFRVRLFVPTEANGETDPLGGVSLNLSIGTKSYAATRQELEPGTVICKKYGSGGWIYYFDLSGEEIVHTLSGGEAVKLDMSLQLLGGTPPDEYELIIDPVFVNEVGDSN